LLLLPAIEEGRERTHADFCRPVVLDGPVLDFVRQRLLSRAEAIGWTPSRDPDLRSMVDGEVRRPLIEDDAAVFLFPASARDVRLMSNTFVPALVGGGDPRPLGVSLTGLVFLGGGEARWVPLDDERLKDGLHLGEAKRRRLALDQARTHPQPGLLGRPLRARRPARDLQQHRDAPMGGSGEGADRVSDEQGCAAAFACCVTTGEPWRDRRRNPPPATGRDARWATRRNSTPRANASFGWLPQWSPGSRPCVSRARITRRSSCGWSRWTGLPLDAGKTKLPLGAG
jgi:hypothetical protein